MNRMEAVKVLAQRLLLDRTNLLESDFADIEVQNVKRKFPIGTSGYRVSFTISHRAIGKVQDSTVSEALRVLIDESD